jgi:hypothetical protein
MAHMGLLDFLKPLRKAQEALFQDLQSFLAQTVERRNLAYDDSDISVTVSGVTGASGSVDASATMTLRTGDVNADGVVNRTWRRSRWKLAEAW